MKIFVLDDSPLRLNIFKRRFQPHGHTVFTAMTAKEAIDIIEGEEDFDIIFLDHDLGGRPPEYYGQDCDPEHKNTGSEVARWLSKNGIPCQVVVHSRNPIGAQSIKDIVGVTAIVMPFDKLTSDWNLGTAW